MGRKKKNNIYAYFDYNVEEKSSQCGICGLILKGNHGANLLRHFYNHHRSEYEKIVQLNEKDKENERPINNSVLDVVIENCTNLVTIHGRPFSMIEDQAFQNILNMISGLSQSDKASINKNRIKMSIEETAYKMRRNIHDEVKNTLVALKVDVASLKFRRFLGINIQYILDGKIVLRNLSVLELHDRNTGTFLKESVTHVLHRFGIEIKQLYSITTDNGTNMLSMCRQIEEELINSFEIEASQMLEQSLEDATDFEDDHYHLLDNLEFEDTETTCDNITSQRRITAVRCAAHTLQLAVRDACRGMEVLFNECRRAVKVLRTPNYALKLRDNDLPQPIVDCATRWDSTADMLERLLRLKAFCQSTPGFELTLQETNWLEIENILICLKPCRALSKSLQKEQLTFGCFYIHWMKCMLEIERCDKPFGLLLCIYMRQRQEALFTNDCFISAIYLDPRVNAVLSAEQLQRAREFLKMTYARTVELTRPNTLQTNETQSSSSESFSDLDIFLRDKFLLRQSTLRDVSNEQLQLDNNLVAFLNQPRLPSNSDIFTYWSQKKISNPQLYLLANIVLATPPTQVSVERLFSSLKFILNNLRMSLKDQIIEDILVVRNNNLYNK